jgi:hypothetical protein
VILIALTDLRIFTGFHRSSSTCVCIGAMLPQLPGSFHFSTEETGSHVPPSYLRIMFLKRNLTPYETLGVQAESDPRKQENSSGRQMVSTFLSRLTSEK